MRFQVLSETLQEPDSVLRSLWTLTRLGVAAVLVVGGCSAYRAWVQVYDLQIVSRDTIASGSSIEVGAVGSGRTWLTVQLLLEQGSRVTTLRSMRVHRNADAASDPRSQHGRMVVGIRGEDLAGFTAGPARLKALAVGRPQWLRTPPPTIVVRDVVLRADQ